MHNKTFQRNNNIDIDDKHIEHQHFQKHANFVCTIVHVQVK